MSADVLAPCVTRPSTTIILTTVYPKKYAHGFCFAVLCCSYTLTDFPLSIRLTSLALWQSNDCPSASKATRMNMDKYFMWIHYERLHNHNKAKHNKTMCIFLGIYCMQDKQVLVFREGRLLLTHWGRDMMAAIFQTTFSNRFSLNEKCINFNWNFTEVCSYVSN